MKLHIYIKLINNNINIGKAIKTRHVTCVTDKHLFGMCVCMNNGCVCKILSHSVGKCIIFKVIKYICR